ncbi:MAG: LysR substrate-binding domain-containing protein [Pseudomonadota bacterium]
MAAKLPPLNAVRAFEACARHLSFSRAADELSVTHSAVSKQVSALEDFIGEQLFDRSGSQVALTDEGRRLRDVVQPAFAALTQVFSKHRRSAPSNTVLRVATVASFAALVLMPMKPEFDRALPDLPLEISTSDRPLDLTKASVDFAIRYGGGNWPGLVSEPLAPGNLVGVVARARSADVRAMPMIQTFASNEWDRVSAAVRPQGGHLLLEHFIVALSAAREGLGVALLPDILVRQSLTDGELVHAGLEDIPWHDTFHLAYDPGTRRLSDIHSFRDELLNRL